MKTITQKALSTKLNLDPPFFCCILKGKKRPSNKVAARLEYITGIGLRTWLFGKPEEIRRELEKIYGKINTKRGRLPGKR